MLLTCRGRSSPFSDAMTALALPSSETHCGNLQRADRSCFDIRLKGSTLPCTLGEATFRGEARNNDGSCGVYSFQRDGRASRSCIALLARGPLDVKLPARKFKEFPAPSWWPKTPSSPPRRASESRARLTDGCPSPSLVSERLVGWFKASGSRAAPPTPSSPPTSASGAIRGDGARAASPLRPAATCRTRGD
eukprot:scaffold1746_cov121-Isochrysis_galbana.AAC.11